MAFDIGSSSFFAKIEHTLFMNDLDRHLYHNFKKQTIPTRLNM